MTKKTFHTIRFYVTGIVTLTIWSLLIWNYYHGGVPSHNILAREDLPSISNGWGAILLPFLTWILFYRLQKRITSHVDEEIDPFIFRSVLYGFTTALLFGIMLSTFFTLKYSDIPGYMINALFIIAIFYPIYRAECLLGFVLGMTYTFGAVLPTGVGSILALIGAVPYLIVRPLLVRLIHVLSPG